MSGHLFGVSLTLQRADVKLSLTAINQAPWRVQLTGQSFWQVQAAESQQKPWRQLDSKTKIAMALTQERVRTIENAMWPPWDEKQEHLSSALRQPAFLERQVGLKR
jgi:hypothetical protein